MRTLTIVVSGMVAGTPHLGGAAWSVLQYVLGLRELGHTVILVEPITSAPPRAGDQPLAATERGAYFRSVVDTFGLAGGASLVDLATHETVGLPYAYLRRLAQRADLLINIAGMLTDPALIAPIPIRLYLDLDPAFTQLWHAVQGLDMRFDGHTHFATVGLAIGTAQCTVPTCGHEWITTLPPVVLSAWPQASHIAHDAFTTIAHWRGYGAIESDGVRYGQKAHSLRPLLALPAQTGEHFLLALAIHPDERADLAALARHGWALCDPRIVAGTPGAYAAFVRGSRAEFGIAKEGYAVSRSGWFSDRSACYLASGRPVIAQETGYSASLPTGEGLLPFVSMDDVGPAIESLRRDYARHAAAARALAVEYFDSARVLTCLLDAVGASQ